MLGRCQLTGHSKGAIILQTPHVHPGDNKVTGSCVVI